MLHTLLFHYLPLTLYDTDSVRLLQCTSRTCFISFRFNALSWLCSVTLTPYFWWQYHFWFMPPFLQGCKQGLSVNGTSNCEAWLAYFCSSVSLFSGPAYTVWCSVKPRSIISQRVCRNWTISAGNHQLQESIKICQKRSKTENGNCKSLLRLTSNKLVKVMLMPSHISVFPKKSVNGSCWVEVLMKILIPGSKCSVHHTH
jgi:hypothetical protein